MSPPRPYGWRQASGGTSIRAPEPGRRRSAGLRRLVDVDAGWTRTASIVTGRGRAPVSPPLHSGPAAVRAGIAGHRTRPTVPWVAGSCEKPATVGRHLDGRAFTPAGYLLTSW